ncbi:Poly(U)-specific endoribonuclease [Thalictrum thalictroides]|uniref:Poly(U)-specific endoribonuclease n=1 Tax=Thalictrum thalictroides TaxID=46969 RepID=A0A7J6WH46_THATH|nr:Poly(U)-specific endoribonuclease [Thalictrum thalictroides]
MEGLIKGLLDVALGNNDDRERESNNSPSRDDRSRSTWAEVVTGEPDKDEGRYSSGGGVASSHDSSNQWNRRKEERKDEQVEEWENAGQRHSRKPQKHLEEEDANNEGWEAVGRRPQKQPHKEEEGANNEGWEAVGRRPQKQPHKVSTDSWQGYKRPINEQKYSDDVEYGVCVEPSNEELSSLPPACEKLWELDSNRLVPGKDYQIDCGEGKKTYQKEDMAQGSLFYWLNEDVFRKPTYSRFCSLLDNYNPNEGAKEVVTSEERQEEEAFIEEISRTAPIKYLHKYLTAKRVVSEDYQSFKKLMINLWFGLYGRGGGSSCSSAFEHVFVGEIKQQGEDTVSGFHNWLQFYLEEAKGRVDYQGYIFPRRRGQTPDSETQLLTLQFEWNGVLKSVSSSLIGVSPEFEVALYTLCFFMGGEDNHIQLGPYSVNIKCYRLGNDKIGSVFPIAE